MDQHLIVTSAEADSCHLESAGISSSNASDICVEIYYSGLNYKDALAVTGRAPILKSYPMVPGIDGAGIVRSANSSGFPKGTKVLVNGSGFGESRNGGFSSLLYSDESLLVPLKGKLGLESSMLMGTAGFTAALALYRMLQNDQRPEMGPILVSGASGGVGSFSVALFSQLGFEVIAMTGKPAEKEYLLSLGASTVVGTNELVNTKSPLGKTTFGGVVDCVGGEFLSSALKHINLFGNLASIGLACSASYQGNVMPHILRGVSILGVSSANTPMEVRRKIWARLGGDWYPEKLSLIRRSEIQISQVVEKSHDLLARKVTGRCVVNLKL